MNKIIQLLALMLICMVGITKANGQDQKPEKPDPIKCKTGIYITKVKINQSDEEFEVSFYWWIRVDSIDLNHDYKKIADIEFANSDSEVEISQEILNKRQKYYYVNGFCNSTISFKPDYHKYPYDTQELVISIENKNYNKNEIIYIKDDNNFINNLADNNIVILNGDQYNIVNLSCESNISLYQTNFGDPSVAGNDEYSKIDFKIKVSRNPDGIMMKLALPLFIVLVLSYLVFYIPDHEIGTASALTVTSLLAAIAFQWTINDSLPKVSYHTFVDKVFHLVYFYIFYAMVQTIVTFNLSGCSQKSKNVCDAIEKHSRWFFPASFAAALYFLLL
jgi:hypothetical protein